MARTKFFTSESITEGHPDKVCDVISDSVLYELLKQDPKSRVACETYATTGQVVVGGEITTSGYIKVDQLIRDIVKSIGYTKTEYKFTHDCGVLSAIHEQSPDISMGVDRDGAGDQGIMFGGAVKETADLMPLPISMARAITNKMTELFQNKTLTWARPDGKSQVTIRYEDDKPVAVDSLVVSIQHDPDVTQAKIREDIKKFVFGPVLESYGYHLSDVAEEKIFVNPTGQFIIGGPDGDVGLTGRKIIVDTYGGYFRHGGGAFSGKDPSKVDRSAAYAARWVAKNIVAAGLAEKCEVQLSYAIGVAKPISIYVDTYGTSIIDEQKIEEAVQKVFDLSPKGIINALSLLDITKVDYRELPRKGHIGGNRWPWEQTNKIVELKSALGL